MTIKLSYDSELIKQHVQEADELHLKTRAASSNCKRRPSAISPKNPEIKMSYPNSNKNKEN